MRYFTCMSVSICEMGPVMAGGVFEVSNAGGQAKSSACALS